MEHFDISPFALGVGHRSHSILGPKDKKTLSSQRCMGLRVSCSSCLKYSRRPSHTAILARKELMSESKELCTVESARLPVVVVVIVVADTVYWLRRSIEKEANQTDFSEHSWNFCQNSHG
jgi:hypothetical protein